MFWEVKDELASSLAGWKFTNNYSPLTCSGTIGAATQPLGGATCLDFGIIS